MSREVDLRRPDAQPDEQRLRTLARTVSDDLPGEQTAEVTALDRMTGNASRVELTSGEAEPGRYAARALAQLRSVGPLLGLTAAQPAEFVPDPVVQATGAGAHTVHLRQQHQGIPVFQAGQAVVFDPSGALASTAGSTVTIDEPLDAEPDVRVQDAVRAAAGHVAEPDPDELGRYDQFQERFDPPAVDLETFEPRVTTVLDGAQDRTTVLEPGPFAEPITAALIWFPLSPGDTRLAWRVTLTMPGHVQRYVILVDARDRVVLYAHQTVLSAAAVGDVYLVDGGRERQRIDFPRTLTDYGLDPPPGLPAGFPDPWLTGDETAGNNVVAHPGDAGRPARGRPDNGRLTFTPDPGSADQQVLNAFALTCSAHDFFYLLGFTEAEGNFQRDSLGRGGAGTDPVDARVFPGPVAGTASMATPVDGRSPVLRLGLVSRTGRHTALDATVVFHEFAHGVTNRLVGGGLDTHALDEPQSAGMGEGWGDFFACLHTGTDVVAAWAVDRPVGIRGHRYDDKHPGHFGRLGIEYREVHEVGEIWCATLMEMTRRLESEQLALRLVMDALKLSRANPSFLDMRDSVLAALSDLRAAGRLSADRFTEARTAVWGAFARFGMGPAARSVGARLQGIKTDFTTPDERPAPVDPVEPVQPVESVAPMYLVSLVLDADGEVRERHVARADGEPDAGPARPDGERQIQYFVETTQAVAVAGPAPDGLGLEVLDLRFVSTGRDPEAAPGEPDRLTATISFALAGTEAARRHALYVAHVVATSADTFETKVVATSFGELSPDSRGGEATMEFPAPPPGRYQLLGGVIAAPYEVIGVESGPSLRVVP